MLILTRKVDEAILIGEDIRLTIVEIRGRQVRLGIEAPAHLSVKRIEDSEPIRLKRASWVIGLRRSTMNRKIYQCQVCGSRVDVSQGAGGFSCCGAPLTFFGESRLEAYREKQAPPIDLIEVRANGNSCWQFLQPGEAPMPSGRVTRAGWRN